MSDVKLIKQLEKELGKKFRPVDTEDELVGGDTYRLDTHQRVIGLKLYDLKLSISQ